MSDCIRQGLYHPNCKDSHTTYFEVISTPPSDNKYAADELDDVAENYKAEQKKSYTENQAEKYDRLAKYSLDEDNKTRYASHARNWTAKAVSLKATVQKLKNSVENSENSGIIKVREMFRKSTSNEERRKNLHFISDTMLSNLTVEARKNGANILRGGEDVEHHLDIVGADASIVGDTILFRKDVCVSEVLEETYHYMQNINHMNDDKTEPLRTILNEIDAKEYLLNNAKKYNIPRNEIETTKKQLESYKKNLEKYIKDNVEYE